MESRTMIGIERKPDLRELIGRSLNASVLTMQGREPHVETALQRVGALGLAALHVHHGADRAGVPVAQMVADPQHVPNPQDVIAADLARSLWHVRYAGQHEVIAVATSLFAAWMDYRVRIRAHFEKHAPASDEDRARRLHCFAACVLHEWLSDRCIACGGSGKVERTLSGAWVKPRGAMQRNATFRVCPACHGSRRQRPSHGARARALGLTHEQYERQRWASHFNAALRWLHSEIMRLMRPLTIQLERSKNGV